MNWNGSYWGLTRHIGPFTPTTEDARRANSRAGGPHAGNGNWMQTFNPSRNGDADYFDPEQQYKYVGGRPEIFEKFNVNKPFPLVPGILKGDSRAGYQRRKYIPVREAPVQMEERGEEMPNAPPSEVPPGDFTPSPRVTVQRPESVYVSPVHSNRPHPIHTGEIVMPGGYTHNDTARSDLSSHATSAGLPENHAPAVPSPASYTSSANNVDPPGSETMSRGYSLYSHSPGPIAYSFFEAASPSGRDETMSTRTRTSSTDGLYQDIAPGSGRTPYTEAAASPNSSNSSVHSEYRPSRSSARESLGLPRRNPVRGTELPNTWDETKAELEMVTLQRELEDDPASQQKLNRRIVLLSRHLQAQANTLTQLTYSQRERYARRR